ncbi:MAG: MFS transporter [Clostridia bacterium]|nr:MFS transporter [Clostridia bacterium]
MNENQLLKNKKAIQAVYLGTLCSAAYLAVYFSRNILGVVSPGMIAEGRSEAYIGKVSSCFFILYAIGQLINGAIGDRIKAKYMICIGLFMAGISNVVFTCLAMNYSEASVFAYGIAGFFLAMIYGPMTKVVAENTEPIYATRCSLGFTFASFVASPLAGVTATFLTWQNVFFTGSGFLMVMSVICFLFFLSFEKKGIISYDQFDVQKKRGIDLHVLLKNRIVKFTLIAFITGVVRTTVVFWLPVYLSQHLSFSPEKAAVLFTVSTFLISFTSFVSIFVYERLNRNMDLTILLSFVSASVFFILLYFVKQPVFNIIFLILAIMSSNSASCMLWSRYCPSLRDTGMVSTVTGFLDFISYIAAALSSTLFANAVSQIGWGNLILVWFGLMILGVLVALSYRRGVIPTEEV